MADRLSNIQILVYIGFYDCRCHHYWQIIGICFLTQRSWVPTQHSALLGKCLKSRFSGRPMPCEGNWVVSLVPDETQD